MIGLILHNSFLNACDSTTKQFVLCRELSQHIYLFITTEDYANVIAEDSCRVFCGVHVPVFGHAALSSV